VALGIAALAGDTNLAERNVIPATPLQPGRVAHESRVESQSALQFPTASDVDAGIEAVSSAQATSNSFMASSNAVAGSHSEAKTAATVATTRLTIRATFDSSIATRPNAAAIEATINQAISIYESTFSDPITIQILFRYATSNPDGTVLAGPSSNLSVVYATGWDTWISSLKAAATTSNDSAAIASLPGNALSTGIVATGANGRALGLNTPPAMFADGTVGTGGPYDGIVTLNSAMALQFGRPTSAGKFDAQRAIEHEIDSIMGLIHIAGNFTPDDLFSWSSRGVRNSATSGTRYFSIDGGATNIVNFNQNPNSDPAAWQSSSCPQAHPYVQNASPCAGQSSDISETTPEGINLDVIGYDLVSLSTNLPSDFNNDGHPDYLLYNSSTRQTVIWYMNKNAHIGGAFGPTLPGGWQVAAVADFNLDSHPDYLLFNPATRQTVIWYMNNNARIDSTFGPTPPSGWSVVAAADFNGDGYPDYLLYNANTRATVIWYMRNSVRIGSVTGPVLPGGWQVAGVGDFNLDGHPDYLLFNPATRQTVIWYMNKNVRVDSTFGPTPPGGWSVVGVADFNSDGYPDYLLYNASTGGTAIWYMRNSVRIGSAAGPALPGGWTLVGP